MCHFIAVGVQFKTMKVARSQSLKCNLLGVSMTHIGEFHNQGSLAVSNRLAHICRHPGFFLTSRTEHYHLHIILNNTVI